MSPENIVVSLENAKKLKEAGWSQEEYSSHFMWFCDNKKIGEENWYIDVERQRVFEKDYFDCLSAPIAEELLSKLPEFIQKTHLLTIFPDSKVIGNRRLYGCTVSYSECSGAKWATSLANACAEMYCHLAKNNLLPSPLSK